MNLRTAILACGLLLLSLSLPCPAQSWVTFSDTWVATDDLGRSVPLSNEVGPPRKDKFVGIFYFLWLGEHGNADPFDITKITAQDPQALQKPDSPLWGPLHAPHHWGESIFGYYLSRDEWVLRKHAQMLSDAGIDAVFFDVTNQVTYPRSYLALCRVWQQVRKEGGKTPQIAFLTPFWDPARVTRSLYEDFYKPGLYSDLWFRWDGKPLILANPDLINPDKLQSGQREPSQLGAGSTLGQSFTADKPFKAIGGDFPTWQTANSSMTLSLYVDGPNGKLLARRRFENVSDNATLLLQFPILPPGNYYLEMAEPHGQIGWWSHTNDVFNNGRAWSDGAPISGDRTLHILYANDSKNTVLSPSSQVSSQDVSATIADIKNIFTFRKPQPDYFLGPQGPGEWGWLEVFPQHAFYLRPGVPEQMTVGVAQNAVDGKLSVLSHPRSHGRSFHNGKQPEPTGQDFTGRNFAEQWQRALQVDPTFIFVTGWNEWIAGRFSLPSPFYAAGPVSFVDQFNTEYSRDIEPMKGGHGDAYYYQLVSNVRRFKGARFLPAAGASRSIKVDGSFKEWQSVEPEYHDDRFDTTHRDSPGWGKATRYLNRTGRNDFVALKVTRDAENLYFYARTREAMTGFGSAEWMQLFIDVDRNGKTGWQGFDYAVNREPLHNGRAVLEKHLPNEKWQPVARVFYAVAGNEIELALPRRALHTLSLALNFDFKWMDNTGAGQDVMNLYSQGDTAPNSRFKYRYVSSKQATLKSRFMIYPRFRAFAAIVPTLTSSESVQRPRRM
jgi:hypothetical protein